MLLTSDELDRQVELYDLPRGICPRCGSGDVWHLWIGMPALPGSMDATPDWVEWVGCVHPGHDRECDTCGLTWTADEA
jgi:hypothetical protein